MKPSTRRKNAAVQDIVEAAERMFAQRGLNDVSLREIGAKAGNANKFAVQYHFGGRDQLIEAVFERRLPALEVRRAELLARVDADGAMQDPLRLLAVIFLPIAEIRDGDGQRTYASFLYRLIVAERDQRRRSDFNDKAPFAKHVVNCLAAALPPMNVSLFLARMDAAASVFLDAVVKIEEGRAPLPDEIMQAEALAWGVAILRSPVPDVHEEKVGPSHDD